MRMWNINPRLLCRQHLLGEHVELHMLAGHLGRGRRLGKLAEQRFVEPTAIGIRHAALVEEIGRRGWNHQSPLEQLNLDHLSEEEFAATVDTSQSVSDLLVRCPECATMMKEAS